VNELNTSLFSEIHFIDIPVSNLESSINWYSNTLGFNQTFRNEDMAIFKLDAGPVLNINRTTNTERPHWRVNEIKRPVIGFLTKDIHASHQELRSKEVKVSHIRDEGMGYFFEFFDLDDNYFSVIQYPEE